MPLVKVCNVDEMPEQSMRRLTTDGQEILVARTKGGFYAVSERCTHRGGPLSEGTLEEKTVTCPWHFGQYDLETGRVLNPPPPEPLRTFEVKVENGTVYVSVP